MVAPRLSQRSGVVESPHRVALDVAEAGLTGLVGALALVLPSVALIAVLADTREYRQPAVAVVVWLVVLAAAGWLVPRLRRDGLAAGETAAAIAVALTAVSVICLAHRPHSVQGGVDLGILGTVGLLVVVVMSSPALVWIPAALLVFAVHAVFVLHQQGLHAMSLSQLAVAGYIMVVTLIVFAVLGPAVAIHSRLAARRASLASRSFAERAAAAAVQQERRSRLAVLEKEALPLLRGIADGTLDSAAADVRDRCATHAAALRHSLTGPEPAAAALVAGLEPALRAARERGLLVTAQLIGDPGTPPPPVARAVLGTVQSVLGALPPQQATLTVLASGEDVELYLTFAAPLRRPPDLTRFGRDLPPAARWHAEVDTALDAAETGTGCLELSWRRDGAA